MSPSGSGGRRENARPCSADDPRNRDRCPGVALVAALAALVVLPLLDVRAEMSATREVVSQQRALPERLVSDSRVTRDLLERQDRRSAALLEQSCATRAASDGLVALARSTLDTTARTEELITTSVELQRQLIELTQALLAETREMNRKFPDNPSGTIAPTEEPTSAGIRPQPPPSPALRRTRSRARPDDNRLAPGDHQIATGEAGSMVASGPIQATLA